MPPRPTVVVDPSFPDRLRALRMERGLSYRALGQLTAYSHVWLWEIETGRKQPTPQMAARLDEVLSTGGTLGRLIASLNAPLDPDDEDRLDAVARHPRTVDHAAITSLSTILAEHRRLEDSVGSAALLRAVAAHLAMVEALVIDARSPLRASVVDMAAQWAQFAGWLSANTHDDCNARRWYSRALEWATEIGNANMISTALNMTGHLEWMAGNIVRFHPRAGHPETRQWSGEGCPGAPSVEVSRGVPPRCGGAGPVLAGPAAARDRS
jgi:transcriptional regulator with XRE-family HTH domain